MNQARSLARRASHRPLAGSPEEPRFSSDNADQVLLAAFVAFLPEQPLAPKGFSATERRRLVRAAEHDRRPIVRAIVTTLLHTGLRVDELVGLTWEQVHLGERSGWAEVTGKRQRRRRVPLNNEVRSTLKALVQADGSPPSGPVFRGKRGPYTARGIQYLLAQLGRVADVQNVHPLAFVTTLRGGSSKLLICPLWPPGSATSVWTPCASTASMLTAPRCYRLTVEAYDRMIEADVFPPDARIEVAERSSGSSSSSAGRIGH